MRKVVFKTEKHMKTFQYFLPSSQPVATSVLKMKTSKQQRIEQSADTYEEIMSKMSKIYYMKNLENLIYLGGNKKFNIICQGQTTTRYVLQNISTKWKIKNVLFFQNSRPFFKIFRTTTVKIWYHQTESCNSFKNFPFIQVTLLRSIYTLYMQYTVYGWEILRQISNFQGVPRCQMPTRKKWNFDVCDQLWILEFSPFCQFMKAWTSLCFDHLTISEV